MFFSADCQSIDIIAVVDGSDSISDQQFQEMRESLKKLAKELNIGPGSSRLGVVVYSSGIAAEIKLSDNLEYLNAKIDNIPHPQDGTETYEGISTMGEIFRDEGREGVPKVGIVITDGKSKNKTRTIAVSEEAQNKGVDMYVVGVTKSIDIEELQGIASKEEWVLTVDGFEHLAESLQSFIKLLCPSKYMYMQHLSLLQLINFVIN